MKVACFFLLLNVPSSVGLVNPSLKSSLVRKFAGAPTKVMLSAASNRTIASSSFGETPGYYLLKSEPSDFSIHDLEKAGEQEWDGVRNFQARNIMRTMNRGDRAFFYHSNCGKRVGIVGTVFITKEAHPDGTAYEDPSHKGYDSKSTTEDCRWDAVSVRLDTVFPTTLTLKELKTQAKHNNILADMTLFRNSRLSVHQLTAEEWTAVEDLVDRKAAGENLLSQKASEND
eukprot:CAMPEP_0202495266 /NCGR_PEP_ID=MMETSP1361-20130828/15907_1 /ASSEMBLY_ACC=CAM_ASM_000849 /TAXON_ID=210615 /ORGANISM="Staurosira complex sp., Strain CCMP2646" /LENGTH=228 /DNA_ID=CAMNT_0049126223 /DNA_START=30 /DNA_END=716 /DNA_ORIENTATION=-